MRHALIVCVSRSLTKEGGDLAAPRIQKHSTSTSRHAEHQQTETAALSPATHLAALVVFLVIQ